MHGCTANENKPKLLPIGVRDAKPVEKPTAAVLIAVSSSPQTLRSGGRIRFPRHG